jgi:hypothetical protein
MVRHCQLPIANCRLAGAMSGSFFFAQRRKGSQRRKETLERGSALRLCVHAFAPLRERFSPSTFRAKQNEPDE